MFSQTEISEITKNVHEATHDEIEEDRQAATYRPLKKTSNRGKEEFDHFANQTWAKLIEECEQDIGCSGLTLFGRLDISLVEIMPHTFQFYVNEVERSATCNLFYDNFTCEGVRLVAKFVDALPRFCRELC